MRSDLLQIIYECIVMRDYRDLPDVARWRVRQEWGIAANKFLVGLVGHIVENKGHRVLVKAASQLIDTIPCVHFVIVGDDAMSSDAQYRANLENMIRELGWTSRFSFVGRRDDIPQVMKALDLLAVPSYSEAFGRVVVEGLASGLPVVASRVGGIPEIITDGSTGILIDPGDVDGLASAIRRLQGDHELKMRIARLGPRSAARFDIGPHVELFSRTYEAILSGDTSQLPIHPFSDRLN